MKVIKKDSTYTFDVDNTLVFDAKEGDDGAIQMNYYGEMVWKRPHYDHISLLKASVIRGRNVVVWSGNGYVWAAEVLTKLNLNKLPVLVLSKPVGYVDDISCEKWMGSHIYIPDNIILPKSHSWLKKFIDKIMNLW